MIDRALHSRLQSLLTQFLVVTVLGPRQCGETTFIREALHDWAYLDLEGPSDIAPLQADTEARLESLGDSVIFDEAQRVPELFAVLRVCADVVRRRQGQACITVYSRLIAVIVVW